MSLESQSSSDDEQECFRLMLGGITEFDVDESAWENASSGSDHSTEATEKPKEQQSRLLSPVAAEGSAAHSITFHPHELENEKDKIWYSMSHQHGENGKVGAPCVHVVDLTHVGRGNGIFPGRPIRKGEVIYTERAGCGVMVQPLSTKGTVKACQHCFRSLEPIPASDWPLPHLWPVANLDFSDSNTRYAKDKMGRLQCQGCQALFCSPECASVFTRDHSSCCKLNELMKSVSQIYASCSPQEQPQAAVLLAIRMFSMLHARLRENSDISCSLFEGLCGDSADVSVLELGIQVKNHETESYSYRLEPIYIEVVRLLRMNEEEKNVLTLESFQQCTAQAARNGFAFRTQSPFKSYYESVIRVCGRGSEEHETMKKTVARFLVGRDTLERGMDRLVDERLSPELCALFVLTARINHSCRPNAQVQSQCFVDCHMDLVAAQDIGISEEITISYLPPGNHIRRANRQRQLASRYLFQCSCSHCSNEPV